MENRRGARLQGVSEISLLTTKGDVIAQASIEDMSEGGLLVGFLPPAVEAAIAIGDKLRFRFVVPTGEVCGSATVVRVNVPAREIALKLVNIDNEGGLGNLLGFLHSWFCGV